MRRAVVVPCATCAANVRVAFDASPEGESVPRDFACPRCATKLSTVLDASAESPLETSEYHPPKEAVLGLPLSRVKTEAVGGVTYYPVMLHFRNGGVSMPLMWPAPLPEVIVMGVSPAVRGFRLHSASPTLVWYHEGAQMMEELSERLRAELQRMLEDERE
jgi:hypothetical protein